MEDRSGVQRHRPRDHQSSDGRAGTKHECGPDTAMFLNHDYSGGHPAAYNVADLGGSECAVDEEHRGESGLSESSRTVPFNGLNAPCSNRERSAFERIGATFTGPRTRWRKRPCSRPRCQSTSRGGFQETRRHQRLKENRWSEAMGTSSFGIRHLSRRHRRHHRCLTSGLSGLP